MLLPLVSSLNRLPLGQFSSTLYKALFLTAYYACLRAGEAVAVPNSNHTLQINQISFPQTASGQILRIKFLTFKHSTSSVTLDFASMPDSFICPVQSLKNYIQIRPKLQGNLFLNSDGSPITRQDYVYHLKMGLKLLGYDDKLFNSHSMRSGRATDLALEGYSSPVIKLAGRWHSSAYEQYIRLAAASFQS